MKRTTRRRWALGTGFVAVVVGGAGTRPVGRPAIFDKAIKELTLPLHHEDVIRQQASEKGVDAALIAAVIYAESKFADADLQRRGARA